VVLFSAGTTSLVEEYQLYMRGLLFDFFKSPNTLAKAMPELRKFSNSQGDSFWIGIKELAMVEEDEEIHERFEKLVFYEVKNFIANGILVPVF
jgi:hypothetical protein